MTEPLPRELAKRLIAGGYYKKEDSCSTDGVKWVSCDKIRDVDWPDEEDISRIGLPFTSLCVDETFYEKLNAICRGNVDEMKSEMEVHDNLALYIGTCYAASDHQVSFVIRTYADDLLLNLRYVNEDRIEYVKTLNVKDSLRRKARCATDVEGKYGNIRVSDYAPIGDKPDTHWITGNYLRSQIANGNDVTLEVEASVRLESGLPERISFALSHDVVSRVCRTLLTEHDYPLDDLLANNTTAVFFRENDVDEADSVENCADCVYILVNESYPGVVKIGKTTNGVQVRIRQLNSTGVPTPFECHYAAFVDDSAGVESHLHRVFDEYRVNANREFFKVDPRLVHKELAKFAIGDATFS